MALAKKIKSAVVKKVVRKKVAVKKPVVAVEAPKLCDSCNGKGLLNSHTLCSACAGSGQNYAA